MDEDASDAIWQNIGDLTQVVNKLVERLHVVEKHPEPDLAEDSWNACYEGACGALQWSRL